MKKYHIVLLVGFILVAGLASAYFYQSRGSQAKSKSEIHVHSDMLVYVNDEQIRFTDKKYQSSFENVIPGKFHFHGEKDDVIHRHADGLTLVNFLDSLGYTLTNDCLTTDDDRSFCSNDNNRLKLFVNKEPIKDLVNYVSKEGDQILLYYGSLDNPNLNIYLESVSNQSCIYSGTCPERGLPPPEECGLTCEL